MDLRKLLAFSVERATWISVVGALLGGVLVFLGSHEDGAMATFLANIGTAVMTVGLVGILYDLLVKRILIAEILGVVGIRESVDAFGLEQIAEHRDVSFENLLEDAKEVTVLPLDPLRWMDQEFEILRRCARGRPLAATLLLPANDSPYVQVLAERLGKTVAQVSTALDQAASGHLGESWEREPVHSGSQLTVKRFSGLPATGLLMTDKIVAIEVGPLIRFRQLDREDFVVVADRSKSPLTSWINAQIKREDEEENLSSIDQRPLSAASHEYTGTTTPHIGGS
jgi:hypothetical protein